MAIHHAGLEVALGKQAQLIHERYVVQRPLPVSRVGIGAVGRRSPFRENQTLSQIAVRLEIRAKKYGFACPPPGFEKVRHQFAISIELLAVKVIMREV